MHPPILSSVFRREDRGQDSKLVPIEPEEAKTLKEYDWIEMVFVPSKKLIKPAYLSWKRSADLRMVRRSLRRLKKIQTLRSKIAVPLIGAGNGQLNADVVEASIKEILGDDDRFTIVYPSRRY